MLVLSVGPAAGPRPEVTPFELVYVTPEDDYDYSRWFSRMWREGCGFINLEPDVLPWYDALAPLWWCPHPVCNYAYGVPGGQMVAALGCIKFSKQFIEGNLELWRSWDGAHWTALDGRVDTALASVGVTPHRHEPPLFHARSAGHACPYLRTQCWAAGRCVPGERGADVGWDENFHLPCEMVQVSAAQQADGRMGTG
jgi:hypothetical protein